MTFNVERLIWHPHLGEIVLENCPAKEGFARVTCQRAIIEPGRLFRTHLALFAQLHLFVWSAFYINIKQPFDSNLQGGTYYAVMPPVALSYHSYLFVYS